MIIERDSHTRAHNTSLSVHLNTKNIFRRNKQQPRKMVCPYRVTVTLFSAIASIFYLRSTMAEGCDPQAFGGGTTTTTTTTSTTTTPKQAMMSPTRRYVIMTLLALLHVDLLLTGYLRMGVKEGMKIMLSK